MVAKSGLMIAAVIALAFAATSHTPTTPVTQRHLAFAVHVHEIDGDTVNFDALRREADAALKALVEKDVGTLKLQGDGQAS